MDTNEVLTLISIIVTFSIGITGFAFTVYQIAKSNKVKHAEFIEELLRNIRLNERVIEATYLIDYNRNWYNDAFHGGSENEKNIDALFSQLDFICYLYFESLLKKKDFSIFKYEIKRVCHNSQCRNYLWDLYHWSKKECSYNNLIRFLKTQLKKTELSLFEDKNCTQYKKFLNF
ncbi:MAG: hypothetical protein IJQ66_07650 [Clostridia bacterium]|nr:hypothetical protein [Clostridia bacterium]